MPNVLVTGGAGYIGSHTVVELVAAGWSVTIVDNFHNSSQEALRRIHAITGKPEAVAFVRADLRDRAAVKALFTAAAAAAAPFDGVIHFAAMKAVGESRKIPLEYYDNNIGGMLTLLACMAEAGCKSIVFSSSCTVYGEGAKAPFSEASPVGGTTNAYATTKHMAEQMLADVARCDPTWRVCILRYFNPVGAHPSGTLGEDPRGVPNCLMPYVQQVLVGRLPVLTVFGRDYATRDGTCVRDYIHVLDVARGHLDALVWMRKTVAAREAAGQPTGLIDYFNFGTGTGSTVLELVAAMEKASGKKVEMAWGARRDGDLAEAYADITKVRREGGRGGRGRGGVAARAQTLAGAYVSQHDHPPPHTHTHPLPGWGRAGLGAKVHAGGLLPRWLELYQQEPKGL
jgi:UDP-glucose 4-epimerase